MCILHSSHAGTVPQSDRAHTFAGDHGSPTVPPHTLATLVGEHLSLRGRAQCVRLQVWAASVVEMTNFDAEEATDSKRARKGGVRIHIQIEWHLSFNTTIG